MNTSCSSDLNCQTTWQEQFVAMMPEIARLLRIAFRHLTPEAREDAAESGMVHCLLSYIRLCEQNRAEAATESSLAWFAALQVRSGRMPGCPTSSKDVLSRYAQLGGKFNVVPLQRWDGHDESWIGELIDTRRSSVLDHIAIKLDFAAWLRSLCRRTRSIAKDLARGFSTSEVAQKHQLSAGRVSQLRRELLNSWQSFQDAPALDPAS